MRGGPSLAVAAVALLAGCGGDGAEPPAVGVETIAVSSPAFAAGAEIPVEYTCDGDETSPPLAWSGVPDGAAALALVVDDPDAPDGPYVHWVVVDIDAGVSGVGAGQSPAGAIAVENSSGATAYAGPCPPSGSHRYRFTVYALSRTIDVSPDDDLGDVFAQIEEAATAQGRLTATYARS